MCQLSIPSRGPSSRATGFLVTDLKPKRVLVMYQHSSVRALASSGRESKTENFRKQIKQTT